VFVSFESVNVLSIFTDEKFKDAYMVLAVMAFYPIHQTYGQLSSSIFYATGKTKLYRNIAFFTQPLMLLLSYLFIVSLDMGALGLALSMLIVQFLGTNIGLYFNSKFLQLNLKYFYAHQIYSVLFFTLLAFATSSLQVFHSALLNFLFSGILYTILVIISSYVFPQIFATTRIEIKENLKRLGNVLKK